MLGGRRNNGVCALEIGQQQQQQQLIYYAIQLHWVWPFVSLPSSDRSVRTYVQSWRVRANPKWSFQHSRQKVIKYFPHFLDSRICRSNRVKILTCTCDAGLFRPVAVWNHLERLSSQGLWKTECAHEEYSIVIGYGMAHFIIADLFSLPPIIPGSHLSSIYSFELSNYYT